MKRRRAEEAQEAHAQERLADLAVQEQWAARDQASAVASVPSVEEGPDAGPRDHRIYATTNHGREVRVWDGKLNREEFTAREARALVLEFSARCPHVQYRIETPDDTTEVSQLLDTSSSDETN